MIKATSGGGEDMADRGKYGSKKADYSFYRTQRKGSCRRPDLTGWQWKQQRGYRASPLVGVGFSEAVTHVYARHSFAALPEA